MKLVCSTIFGMILALLASVYVNGTLDKVLPLKCYTTGVVPEKASPNKWPVGTFEYEQKRTI